jgi:hypothetical protein
VGLFFFTPRPAPPSFACPEPTAKVKQEVVKRCPERAIRFAFSRAGAPANGHNRATPAKFT